MSEIKSRAGEDGMGTPTIVIIKEGELKQDISPAFDCLLKLNSDSKIKLITITVPEDMFISEELRTHCHAILCRPLWLYNKKIKLDFVNSLRKQANNHGRFYIATLSASTSHIEITKEVCEDEKIEILRSEGGNADQTAEMTVYLAISLKRQTHFHVANMGFGINLRHDSENYKSLRNCTWTILGRGHVARSLIRRLLGLGLQRIIVWNHRMSLELFQEIFDDLSVITWLSRSEHNPCVVIGSPCPGPSCVIEGTMNIENALSNTDIVSIHVDLHNPDNTGMGGTINLIKSDMIKKMKPSAVIVNAARHGIVNIEDIVEALINGELAGFGSDVLEPDAEKEGVTPRTGKSLLWQAYCFGLQKAFETNKTQIFSEKMLNEKESEELTAFAKKKNRELDEIKKLNILLTPHLGGWTKDAEDEIASEVIGKLLIKLGLKEYVNFYTPRGQEKKHSCRQ